ncbi:MAG: hypothetical protein QNJ97_16815 [Myxococcota bacterium]|nr:hypothetical protein [Myxococcota bacterium]
MKSMNRPIDDETLTAYVLGELDDGEKPAVADAVKGDAALQDAVSALDNAAKIAKTAFASPADAALQLTDAQRADIRNHAVQPEAADPNDTASGLIDMQTLAKGREEKAEEDIDDLVELSTNSFAPVLQPDSRVKDKRLIIGIPVGVAVAVGIIAVAIGAISNRDADKATDDQIALLQDQVTALQNKTNAPPQIALQGIEPVDKTAPPEAHEKVHPAEKSSPENAEKPAAVSEDSAQRTAPTTKQKTSVSAKKPKRSNKNNAVSETTQRSSGTSKTGKDDIEALLGGSAPTARVPKKAAASRPGGNGTTQARKKVLDRSDVQAGMRSVAARVRQCAKEKRGTITLKVVIGPTGRVITAVATGPFAGTPVGTCAAKAVRSARFPKSDQNLTIRYPFKL